MSVSDEQIDWMVNRFESVIDTWSDEAPHRQATTSNWEFRISEFSANDDLGRWNVMPCIDAIDQIGRFGTLSEFAHGAGDTFESAFEYALRSWVNVDLPVLADAHFAQALETNEMRIDSDHAPARIIRLGPLQLISFDGREPCCNTCITVQALQAGQERLLSSEVQFLKFVVARQNDGTANVDARINGEQDEAIAEALRHWTSSWDSDGFEMRKQAVLLFSETT